MAAQAEIENNLAAPAIAPLREATESLERFAGGLLDGRLWRDDPAVQNAESIEKLHVAATKSLLATQDKGLGATMVAYKTRCEKEELRC